MSAQKSRYPKNPSSVTIKAVTIVLLFVVVIVRVGSHARLDRPMRDADYLSTAQYRARIGVNALGAVGSWGVGVGVIALGGPVSGLVVGIAVNALYDKYLVPRLYKVFQLHPSDPTEPIPH